MHVLERGAVARGHVGVGQQPVDHGGRQEDVRDALALDRLQDHAGVGRRRDHVARAEARQRDHRRARGMRERRDDQVHRILARRRELVGDPVGRLERAVALHDRLRAAGGAAGRLDERDVVEASSSVAGLSAVLPLPGLGSPAAECSPNAMQAVSVGTSDRIRSMWGRYCSWYTSADISVNRMNQIRSSIWSRALSGT